MSDFTEQMEEMKKIKIERLGFVIGEDYIGTREEQLLDILSAIGFYSEERFPDFYDYLMEEGFCTAPASTKYHGNYPGGLYDHSLEVTRALFDLTQKLDLKWKRYTSPIIVGMFHDLCKLDSYNAQEDENGNVTYSYRNDQLLTGHGDKSIILLQRFANLTEEEMLCIRWHMGAFDEKDNWNYYARAIEKYPNVLYTHTADMIASRIKGI